MLKELEIKEMTAPINLKKECELEVPNYLIQNLDIDNYVIHRELIKGEMRYYRSGEVFKYKGKRYLACISNARTEESAEFAVKSYWQAFKKFNNRTVG
ncbi:hypothetical protein M3175_20440 [Robertmurraya korlensis]|uniref:hypothetical protein n=1 Tax=Robertmurraya korlensis TaxID=519977 RepID=UPI00203C711E|nr:hypothetical protein [Robertmurraya korlensis]MCM3603111.1 hypothetical protein [Robertmurraya korlensis]